jgi:hypothetical protein
MSKLGSTMKAASNLVTSKAGRSVLKVQKHSPNLLFAAGVVGFAGTVVMASRSTLRLDDTITKHDFKNVEIDALLDQNRPDYTEKDAKHDKAVIKLRLITDLGKLYAPAIGLGVLTVCAFGGAHVVLTKRNAGLTAAYVTLDKAFNEYRSRVTTFVGTEKERELRFGSESRDIAVDDAETGRTEVKTIDSFVVPEGTSDYAKIFSKDTSLSWSPQPEYNMFFLKSQQNYLNDMLRIKGHVFLNEVYDALGVDRTKAGAVTGWVKDNKRGGDNFIDFGIFNGENPAGFHDFFTGREGAILLDFNVDGVVYDLI